MDFSWERLQCCSEILHIPPIFPSCSSFLLSSVFPLYSILSYVFLYLYDYIRSEVNNVSVSFSKSIKVVLGRESCKKMIVWVLFVWSFTPYIYQPTYMMVPAWSGIWILIYSNVFRMLLLHIACHVSVHLFWDCISYFCTDHWYSFSFSFINVNHAKHFLFWLVLSIWHSLLFIMTRF